MCPFESKVSDKKKIILNSSGRRKLLINLFLSTEYSDLKTVKKIKVKLNSLWILFRFIVLSGSGRISIHINKKTKPNQLPITVGKRLYIVSGMKFTPGNYKFLLLYKHFYFHSIVPSTRKELKESPCSRITQ